MGAIGDSFSAHGEVWHTTGTDAISLSRLKRTVRLGIKSLWMHRLRSLLTVLGIVFGVCSVIAMLAIGEGASYEVQEQIRRLGSNNIILRSVKPPEDLGASARRSMLAEYGLKYDDMARIENTIPGVQIVMPNRIIRKDVWVRGRRVACDVVGTMPFYPTMANQRVTRGRFFTALEDETNQNVCVLEAGMARELFPIDDPLEKTVRVASSRYRVVGVIEPKTTVQLGSSNGDKNQSTPAAVAAQADSSNVAYRMYIPLGAARNRFGELVVRRSSGSFEVEKVELHEATVRVARLEDVLETKRIIEGILERNHKKKDYDVVAPLQLLRDAERTKRIFNVVLGAIAAISLIVGGIGIMNIMLASVTERTREIGIRRALGAKRKDIILQFLVETVLLSGAGGLIGVGLGIIIPYFVERFAHMETIVTFWSPMIAFTISALVGVVFGIYPAFRAANMDPVEALRHE